MMIEIIQGTPGSGKSAVSLLTGIFHLMSGGVLATNFDLVDDWAYRLAGQNLLVRMGLRSRSELAASYYSRCFKIGDADTLYKLSGKINDLVSPRMRKRREGKALVIMDEAQFYFNSRNWKDNMSFIEYFTQHRKLGFDVLMVAHSVEMIDKQVRSLIEIESFFRNLKNIRFPVLGFPLSLGANVFFVVRKYAGLGPGRGMKHSTDFYVLDKASASLYDTFEVFTFNGLSNELTKHGRDPALPKFNSKSVSSAETYPKYHERIPALSSLR